MAKKTLTITWTQRVTVEVPEDISDKRIFDAACYSDPMDKKADDVVTQALKEAADCISWKDGVITEIKTVE